MPDPEAAEPIGQVRLAALLFAQAAAFTGIGLAAWHYSGRDPAEFVRFSWRAVIEGLALAAGFIAAAAALFRLSPALSERLVRMQAETYRFIGRDAGMPLFVAISLAAGIGEEALFRGGLQTLIGDHLGVPLAIVLVSAAFAAIHRARPLVTAILFVVGALFGAAYWYTGSLLAVMIGHVLYDIWAIAYLHREMARLGLFDARSGDGGA